MARRAQPALPLLQRIDELYGQGASHAAIGLALGIKRSRVSNLLRLKRLPPPVLAAVRDGRLSLTHGVVLLGAPSRVIPDLAALALNRRWSLTQLRQAVRRTRQGVPIAELAWQQTDIDVTALANSLSELIGSPVTLRREGAGAWQLVIRASDSEVLEGILERLGWRGGG